MTPDHEQRILRALDQLPEPEPEPDQPDADPYDLRGRRLLLPETLAIWLAGLFTGWLLYAIVSALITRRLP